MKIIRHREKSGTVGYAAQQPDGSHRRVIGDLFGDHSFGEHVVVGELLAPVEPVAIWCIGQNYRRHAAEVKMAVPEFPVVFAKGVNAVQRPGGPILLPRNGNGGQVDYECELVVVIGKTCKNVSSSQALDHVLGYTCGNDVSERDWQLKKGGSQWSRGKSFDTFAPIGPWIVTTDEISDPNKLQIQTLLNGEVMQDWNTNDMIFDVPTLIAFLSQSTTLLPSTLIFTGTPHGIGMSRLPPRWLRAGDEVRIVIEGIGTLTNPVQQETMRAEA